MSKTPYDEGWQAGYQDAKTPNPYLKAADAAVEVIRIAFDYERGFSAGQARAAMDIADKRRESCR